ncbi:MAG: hypothetical protein MJY95_08345 [Bacteroidaceae bacterium]|nr:hypothetical protein [Bacteroidaceae bacterium]
MEKAKEILKKTEKQNFLSGLDFSVAIQDLLISEGGWVIDTGNYENVNAECLIRLMHKIEKHPFLWKMFFMIA